MLPLGVNMLPAERRKLSHTAIGEIKTKPKRRAAVQSYVRHSFLAKATVPTNHLSIRIGSDCTLVRHVHNPRSLRHLNL